MALVAAELGLHPRTLRRRLAQHVHTFEALRDAVGLAVARELLDLSELPVGEIAAALGYASPEVFAGSFRRISGTSATDWRRRHPSHD